MMTSPIVTLTLSPLRICGDEAAAVNLDHSKSSPPETAAFLIFLINSTIGMRPGQISAQNALDTVLDMKR